MVEEGDTDDDDRHFVVSGGWCSDQEGAGAGWCVVLAVPSGWCFVLAVPSMMTE